MTPTRKPRAERRAQARLATKDIRDRERLATLEPGGSPDRPIEIVSASLVEPKARDLPCVICGGAVHLDDHTARTIDGLALRLAHVRCPSCSYARAIYFLIDSELPN
jgi:hypothetical protein